MPHQPITATTYTLTRADALAWLSLPREMAGWRRVAFLVWLGLSGLTLGALPAAWQAGWRFWPAFALVMATHWAVAALWMTLRRHRAARRMVPAPRPMRLEIWGDHLQATGGPAPLTIAPETIRQVVVTDSHVFIDSPPAVLILPLAAFDDAADMRAFAAEWDALSQNAAA